MHFHAVGRVEIPIEAPHLGPHHPLQGEGSDFGHDDGGPHLPSRGSHFATYPARTDDSYSSSSFYSVSERRGAGQCAQVVDTGKVGAGYGQPSGPGTSGKEQRRVRDVLPGRQYDDPAVDIDGGHRLA